MKTLAIGLFVFLGFVLIANVVIVSALGIAPWDILPHPWGLIFSLVLLIAFALDVGYLAAQEAEEPWVDEYRWLKKTVQRGGGRIVVKDERFDITKGYTVRPDGICETGPSHWGNEPCPPTSCKTLTEVAKNFALYRNLGYTIKLLREERA